MSARPLPALAAYLRTIRWSGSDLARAVGVTPAYVNQVLAGRKAPSRRFVRDVPIILAPILGVDSDDLRRLFFGNDNGEREAKPSVLQQRLLEEEISYANR